jgi:hypothetical protein
MWLQIQFERNHAKLAPDFLPEKTTQRGVQKTVSAYPKELSRATGHRTERATCARSIGGSRGLCALGQPGRGGVVSDGGHAFVADLGSGLLEPVQDGFHAADGGQRHREVSQG